MIRGKKTAQVLMLGGGVIGCLSALRLAQAGYAVTLVERGALGRAASWAAAGILSPGAEAEGAPFARLARHSRMLWQSLVDELGGEALGWRAGGTLRVALDEREARFLDVETSRLAEWGIGGERMSSSDVAQLEPQLCRVQSGVRFGEDHQVDPRRVMATLSAALAEAGVHLVRGAVETLLVDGKRCCGARTSTQELRADATVVALGSWSSLVPGLPRGARATTVAPLRGQMIELKLPSPPVEHTVFGAGGYLLARADGRLLCGATEERAGYSTSTTVEAVAELRRRAARLCPALDGMALADAWAGLRPTTADRLPVLGATQLTGLYLATGHHRNGYLLAPATAEAVVALVEERAPPIPIDAFSPLRDGS